MPFSAELRVPVQGSCLKSLCQSSALRSAVQQATEWEGELRIDVLPLLLLTDAYGEQYAQAQHDIALWKGAASSGLLTEVDLTSPKYEGFIGRWNLPLLHWLKDISVATQDSLTVYYAHERGDTPYEYARWSSSPVSAQGPSETFALSSYGGMDEAEWEFEVVRFADGRSEVAESGECDEPPRYL
jgi:hypothetical protein